jgi:hypothetical protein
MILEKLKQDETLLFWERFNAVSQSGRRGGELAYAI